MMQQPVYKSVEFLLLFILYPISLRLNYALWLKLALGLLGFLYVLWILLRVERVVIGFKKNIPWRRYLKHVGVVFLFVIAATSMYVLWQSPYQYFSVPIQKPGLFAVIFLVYGLLSVWPQEIIFRTFYYQRYEAFFHRKWVLVLINSVLFSLAHLFFRNTLVLILTFLGGILFGITYLRFRSTTLVSIEHALYGNWLFAVGMGEMLGFPA